MGTHGRFSALFYKGDNLCDFLFTILHTKPFLKRGLLKGNNVLPLRAKSFLLVWPSLKIIQNASVSPPKRFPFFLLVSSVTNGSLQSENVISMSLKLVKASKTSKVYRSCVCKRAFS